MEISSVTQTPDGWIVNGTFHVPADPANRHYQQLQDWLADGGVADDGRPSIARLKALKKAELERQAEGMRQAALGNEGAAKQLVYREKEQEAVRILADPNANNTPELYPWAAAEAPTRGLTIVEMAEDWAELAGKFRQAGIAIEAAYVAALMALQALPDTNDEANRTAIENVAATWPPLP